MWEESSLRRKRGAGRTSCRKSPCGAESSGDATVMFIWKRKKGFSGGEEGGRGDWIRTSDIQLPKLTLYQTEPRPVPGKTAGKVAEGGRGGKGGVDHVGTRGEAAGKAGARGKRELPGRGAMDRLEPWKPSQPEAGAGDAGDFYRIVERVDPEREVTVEREGFAFWRRVKRLEEREQIEARRNESIGGNSGVGGGG